MRILLRQMVGAARLDAATYEHVEADRRSNASAILIVILSSVAAAFGSGSNRPGDVAGVAIAAVVSWLVWIGLTLFIGTRIMPGPETRADIGEVLRTTGFSAAPGILRIFGVLPTIGLPIFVGVTGWMLLSFVVAIRHALDYETWNRALAVCLLGWLIHGILFFGFVAVAVGSILGL